MSLRLSTEIRIEYQTKDGKSETFRLEPESFFEANPQVDDSRSLRDIVWSRNHAVDYLGIPLDIITATSLDVYCAETKERIRDVEQFWNDGNCRIISRRETVDDREIYCSGILEIHTAEGIHFVRLTSDAPSESGLSEHHVVLPNDEVRYLFP